MNLKKLKLWIDFYLFFLNLFTQKQFLIRKILDKKLF
jgi:hypothetical protein